MISSGDLFPPLSLSQSHRSPYKGAYTYNVRIFFKPPSPFYGICVLNNRILGVSFEHPFPLQCGRHMCLRSWFVSRAVYYTILTHYECGASSAVSVLSLMTRVKSQVNPIFPHLEAYTEGRARRLRGRGTDWMGGWAIPLLLELTISPPPPGPSKALQQTCDLRV